MTDSITPVGNTVNPGGQGLSSLSDILGIQQKRIALQQQAQALQTGAYTQQSAQANAQQAQQQNTELQQAASTVRQGAQNGKYSKPDGSFDRVAAANDISQIGPYAQANANQLLSGANELVQNKETTLKLTNEQRSTIGSTLQSLAGDQNVDNTKIINAVGALRDQFHSDPDLNRLLDSTLMHMPQNANSQTLQQSLGNMAASLTGQSPIKEGTNAAGQNQVVSTMTGARSAPQLNGTTNPGSPQVAQATAANVSRAGGSGNADIDASNNVSASLRDARTNIDLTKRIDQLADVVDPGALPAKVSHALGALGLQDVNQARTELQKDLGRLRSSASSRAQSDSRANEILSGLPTDQTPTQTIHQAMDVTRGSARQDLALGALQAKTRQQTSGQMTGFQGDYSHAVSSASPLMHEYLSLSPADQVGFFKRNFQNATQAKAFRAQAESVKKLSPDVVGQ
jgi:hypothetical protein